MAFRSILIEYESTNAVLGWAGMASLLIACVELAKQGEILWTGLALTAFVIAIIPPIVSRQPTEMIAWEVLALTALPIVARATGVFVDPMSYLAVAALALVVAVELDELTDVDMTPAIAFGFVIIVTMTTAGVWAIARYASDIFLATSFLTDQTALMWDLIIATVTGGIAGIVFEWYFRRIRPGHSPPVSHGGKIHADR